MVKRKGFVNVSPNGAMKIFDVIYVLGLTKNPLFVGILAKKWYITMFDDTKCLISMIQNTSLANGYVTQQVGCVHTLWQTLFSNFCCWISKDDYALALMAWTLWTFIVCATHLNFVQHLTSSILLTPCIKEVCQSFMQGKKHWEKVIKSSERWSMQVWELVHNDM